MADPASAAAGASRSRRKRALPPQRAQTKRLRTQSPSSNKAKPQNSASDSQLKPTTLTAATTNGLNAVVEPVATSLLSPNTTTTTTTSSFASTGGGGSKSHSGAKKKSNRSKSDLNEASCSSSSNTNTVSTKPGAKRSAGTSTDAASTKSAGSGRKSATSNKLKKTSANFPPLDPTSDDASNNTPKKQGRHRRTKSKQKQQQPTAASGSYSDNLLNSSAPPEESNVVVHKYPLRSQGRLSDPGLRPSSASATTTTTTTATATSSKSTALGAAGSQDASREETTTEPSRLTRSGAVLRRSTRNSKGHSSTTGSCASSSGGRGSSSSRASRQHKVGATAPAPVPATPAMASSDQLEASSNNGLPVSEEPPSPQEATQAMASSGGPSGPGPDSESDDSEVGRLQALLEARGLPPQLFGALGPRMQQMLHRSMGASSSVAKATQLLQGLQASGDEGQQLQAVIEMCQMLVMGNEDTLTGFPVKQVVPALIALLRMEHNFDIMNHACRALTYMMEALPRSSAVVVDAVPVFLEKLQVIQCMDVAEQSLTALDMLSHRHSKAILQARGVTACLMYLDFFSINAQRNALSVTANCCLNMTSEEFQYVAESLPLLANRLTQQDKKSVECVCSAFSRLVDSFQLEPARLQEIASTELLTNLQQLLVVTPPVISTGTFITVLRTLCVMCANCPDLALTLLKQNIAETLLYLLTGSAEVNQEEVELVPRQPQELYEITALIGELMPKLPTDGIFVVDTLLERPANISKDQPTWQWRDDRGLWHAYGAVDSRMIEAAHMNGDDEVSLNTLGRTYTIDFHSMQQINEDTGTSRPVQRRFTPANNQASQASSVDAAAPPGSRPSSANRDARVACLREERGLAAAFIRSLFSVLYEVYSSSAGPTVRCKCLKALLRMVYYASPELLKEVLKSQVVSSHIAGMMASSDLRIVVGALQMAEILMSKLPDVFGIHFRREGVMHQINQLADPEVPLGVSPPKSANSTTSFGSDVQAAGPSQTPNGTAPSPTSSSTLSSTYSNTSVVGAETPQLSVNALAQKCSKANTAVTTTTNTTAIVATAAAATAATPTDAVAAAAAAAATAQSPPLVRISDVLKRKRAGKRCNSGRSSKPRHDEIPLSPSLMHDLFSKATSLGTTNNASSTPSNSAAARPRFSGNSKTTSFLQSLNPARWGRNMNSSSNDRNYGKDMGNCLNKSSSNSNLTAGNREKTRQWIRDQATKFIDIYSTTDMPGAQHPAMNVLSRLTSCIQRLPTAECGDALQELREILIESDISPFEVNHSGLIKALLSYLASTTGPIDRDQRLRIFLHVFANCPLDLNVIVLDPINATWMSALVAKLSGCVSQLEQFPVKVHDLPAGSGAGRGGTSALKFFNTHQLKCNLQRHPECTNLKQWKGGTVKIDPLALVQAIERYLVVRGYGRVRDKDSADSDEGDSDDDIEETLATVVISASGSKHKLQFLIGNTVLPYNMTVYQAVRQFSNNGNDQSETDTDNETPLGHAGVWIQTHTIYYRPLKEEPSVSQKASATSTASGSRKGKGSTSKNALRRKGDELWNEGQTPSILSPLTPFLLTALPESVTIQDASLEVLCLLRILNALNQHWSTLYTSVEHAPILHAAEFLNSKIAAKASRQLQDPLVIMTGNLPNWLQQIASACPFLFPFETRQLLFYATSFDRDRALQKLLDMTPELSSTDSQERVTPRLDRRKRTISREDILKQAEQVMQDLATSKALLEVQYENEVGTGLGPTLEFYTLVSKELQRADLELWHAPDNVGEYVYNAVGLFASPLPRNAKVSQVTKIKTKFRFVGKFMAKAVMDSRMLDLPFSLTFYKWILGYEHSLGAADLQHIAPDIYKTIKKMQELVRQRDSILSRTELSLAEQNDLIEKLEFDGCTIADLGIDFVLPGTNIELLRNGRVTSVTIHNLHMYVNLVLHWFLVEGVGRQMESFREGFESVFPVANLRMFQPEELEAVFCGSPRDSIAGWDVKTLMECCRPDHGYTVDSRAVRFLFDVLSSYTREEQRLFVQFLTGSPRLPVGGFKSLSPPLTVVRRDTNLNPDDFLPSVMTCVNYLKLPDYSSIEVMREKLCIAASEGQHSFHLS